MPNVNKVCHESFLIPSHVNLSLLELKVGIRLLPARLRLIHARRALRQSQLHVPALVRAQFVHGGKVE
jgi:hypothetical protein